MLSRDYIVRPYQIGDEEKIVDLLEMAFNSWPHLDLSSSKVDYWRWKHLNNPIGKSIVLVASHDGEIIGCNHTMPLRLKIGREIYLGGIGVDEAVHPDFRGRGVWNDMAEMKKKMEKKSGMAIRLGLTLNPLLERHYRRSKERTLFPHNLIYMVRIKNVSSQIGHLSKKRALTKKYGFNLLKFHNKLKNLLRTDGYVNLASQKLNFILFKAVR